MTNEIVEEVGISIWSIDPTHSSVHFKVRHMAIAWVRGEFRALRGTLNWNENKIEESRVEVEIDPSSVYSSEPKRDDHLRNADFLDVERFPSIHFQSTHVSRLSRDTALVVGDLTLHGVCRPVELRVTEISAAAKDPSGNIVIGASAIAKLNRKEFGLTWNKVLEAGGFLIGDEIVIDLDIEFVKATN